METNRKRSAVKPLFIASERGLNILQASFIARPRLGAERGATVWKKYLFSIYLCLLLTTLWCGDVPCFTLLSIKLEYVCFGNVPLYIYTKTGVLQTTIWQFKKNGYICYLRCLYVSFFSPQSTAPKQHFKTFLAFLLIRWEVKKQPWEKKEHLQFLQKRNCCRVS